MNNKSPSHQRLRHCAFSQAEDSELRVLVEKYGTDAWQEIANRMVRRSARQCKERWRVLTVREMSQRPWTDEEDQLLVRRCCEMGPKWRLLETLFTGRTSQSIKNRWNILTQRAERDSLEAVERPPVVSELKSDAEVRSVDDVWGWLDSAWANTDAFDLFGTSDDQIWGMINLPQTTTWY